MPLKRRLVKVGKDSRAVILPREWIREAEEKYGKKLETILLEVDNVITITIAIPKEEEDGGEM